MNQLVSKAAQGFSLLMIVRVFSRFIDFFLNMIVIRKIDPQSYGLTTHLGLLTNFSLFYLKVCLKQAYQRRCQTIQDSQQQQALIINSAKNMMLFGGFITIFITAFISLIIALIYSSLNPYFIYSCILHAIAAVIEAAAEPLTVSFILNFNYAVPAQAESISVFIKTLSLYLFCITFEQDPLIAFGYSQLLFSIALLLTQLYHSLKQMLNILQIFYRVQSFFKLYAIQKIGPEKYIQDEMKEMGFQFTLMAFLKFILQELEKIVIISFWSGDPTISGEFSLVSHIGALVPRFIYSPIEDVSFNLFSKMAADKNEKSQMSNEEESKLIDSPKHDDSPTHNDSIRTQVDYLKKILIFINTLGMAFIFAGIPLSNLLIQYAYGEQWNTHSCVTALKCFCIYEWVMGINGITEAFVNGNLHSSEMQKYRYILMIITTIYIISSIMLVNFGASGIIIANIISMICRIIVSMYIIKNKCFRHSYKQFKIEILQTLPQKNIWFLYIMVNLVIYQYLNLTGLYHQLIYIVALGIIFCTSMFQIKPTILQLYNSKNQ